MTPTPDAARLEFLGSRTISNFTADDYFELWAIARRQMERAEQLDRGQLLLADKLAKALDRAEKAEAALAGSAKCANLPGCGAGFNGELHDAKCPEAPPAKPASGETASICKHVFLSSSTGDRNCLWCGYPNNMSPKPPAPCPSRTVR